MFTEGVVSEGEGSILVLYAQHRVPALKITSLPLQILFVAPLLHSPDDALKMPSTRQRAIIDTILQPVEGSIRLTGR